MKLKLALSLILAIFPLSLFSAQSIYCPGNHGFINVGMSEAEVLASCGNPTSMQESDEPVYKKIPVQQLIFNNQGTATAFYDPWTIPTRWTGSKLEVDVVDNKVEAIRINGGDQNAMSICQGISIQPNDPVGKVYGACGPPSLVNNTFVYKAIPSKSKPKIWIYQPSPYQPSIVLTFIDGKLQSIN